MTGTQLRPPIPLVDVDSAPWWEALKAGTFTVDRCQECRRWAHPPLERCRTCGGQNTLEPVSGQGRIFSFIVVRHQSLPGLVPPYVVAIVELDEQDGLRVTGIVRADPEAVSIGGRVSARIDPIGDSGYSAPAFELTPQSDPGQPHPCPHL